MNKKTSLVLDCKGSLGITYIGVIKALESSGKMDNFDTYIGNSMGSIFVLLINLGYTSDEIQEIFIGLDFDKMYSLSTITILKKGHYGDIKYIMKILEKLIEAKYDKSITFKELFEKTNKKLVINTLCLCDNTSLSLNYIDNPDLSILFAIKMSISIPYIFPFVEHEEKYYAGGICQPLYHTYGDDHLIITIGKQVVNNSSMTMKEKQKDKFYLLKQLMQSIGHNTSSGENILTIPNNGIHFLSNPTDIERMNMIQSGFIGIIEFCEK